MGTQLNRVVFLGPFRRATGVGAVEVAMNENETVQNLLTKLIDKFGQEFKKVMFDETGRLRQDLVVRLDGENIDAKEGLGTQVRAGQELMIMPAVTGG
jgi:MoaD family protein